METNYTSNAIPSFLRLNFLTETLEWDENWKKKGSKSLKGEHRGKLYIHGSGSLQMHMSADCKKNSDTHDAHKI